MNIIDSFSYGLSMGWWIGGVEGDFSSLEKSRQKKAKECFEKFSFSAIDYAYRNKYFKLDRFYCGVAGTTGIELNEFKVKNNNRNLGGLRIVNNCFKDLPSLPNIFSHPTYMHLTLIKIRGCALRTLPSSFAKLNELCELDLGYNQITEEGLKHLPHNLQILELMGNQIQSLEKFSAEKFLKLRVLNVADNPLHIYPHSLANIPNLEKLFFNGARLGESMISKRVLEKKNLFLIYNVGSNLEDWYTCSVEEYPELSQLDSEFVPFFARSNAFYMLCVLDSLLSFPLNDDYKKRMVQLIRKNQALFPYLGSFCLAYRACHNSLSHRSCHNSLFQGQSNTKVLKEELGCILSGFVNFLTESPNADTADYELLYRLLKSIFEIICPSNLQFITDEFVGNTAPPGRSEEIAHLPIGTQPLGAGGRPIKSSLLPGVSLEREVCFLLSEKRVVVTVSNRCMKKQISLYIPDTVVTYRDLNQFGLDLGNNKENSLWRAATVHWSNLIEQTFFAFSTIDETLYVS